MHEAKKGASRSDAWEVPGLPLLSFVAPLVGFLLSVSETAGFLDEGEFVAQGVWLGISHPPGQPLPGVLFGLATLLPFGSMALRVGLVSAITAAGAGYALFRAAQTLGRALGPRSPWARDTLSLAVSFVAVLGPASVMQAVRPEVYAPAAFCLAVAIERLVRFAIDEDERAAVGAALALGLAASCHPFMALVVLLAALLAVGDALLASTRLLLRSIGAFCLGLVPLLYLPLRALVDPALNLGEPSTLGNFLWVVSARAFQKNQGAGVPEAGSDRAFDTLFALAESLGPVTVVLAGGGAYLALRSPRARRAAWLLLAVALLTAGGRAWLGFVRHNPDALGYLLPAVFALALLAGWFVGILVGAIPDELPAISALGTALTVALALLAAAGGVLVIDEHGRRDFHEAAVFDDEVRRRLPDDAIVFAYGPQTIFQTWGFEAEERARPDVLLVPVPLISYPGMVDHLLREEPRLRDVLRSLLLTGSLGLEELQSLAAERPVIIELDPRVEPELYSLLVPAGTLHRVMAEGATPEDVAAGRNAQLRAMQRLRNKLGPIGEMDARAKEALLVRLYNQALYFAAVGERDAARFTTRDALLFSPESPELLGLRDALQAEGKGPIDVSPYRLP